MEKVQLDRFRKRLIELRTELENMAVLSSGATRPVELDQTRVGRLSRMDAMQGQQMALEANRRREHQLMRINGALRRIESGTFGLCGVCGDEIDQRRLWADPSATKCLSCASR